MKRQQTIQFLITLLMAPVIMVAQEYRATILGQVVDSSQSAIPRATVKAIKPDTNFSKETVTNEQGIYTISGLDPGLYNLTITASGFQTTHRNSIVLQVAEKQNLKVTLEVGAVTQEVTVEGTQELVQSASASRVSCRNIPQRSSC